MLSGSKRPYICSFPLFFVGSKMIYLAVSLCKFWADSAFVGTCRRATVVTSLRTHTEELRKLDVVQPMYFRDATAIDSICHKLAGSLVWEEV